MRRQGPEVYEATQVRTPVTRIRVATGSARAMNADTTYRRADGAGRPVRRHDAESAPGLAGGARERGASSHRRCGQDQYAIVPENKSASASVTPTLPAPVACANRPVPPVACQKIATSSMTSGFGHG